LRKVYSEEKEDVIKIISKARKIDEAVAEDLPNYFIQMMNDSTKSVPLTLKSLYQFIAIAAAHMVSNDSIQLSQFYFNYVFNEFANLDPEIRFIMITFKVGFQCLQVSFGSQPQLDQLLPGVSFPGTDLEEYKNIDDGHHRDLAHGYEFEDDNLGNFRCFKLGKFEKAFISNLAKDTESYLFLFKIISKLFRSCQIISDAKTNYEESPYRMDNVLPLGFVNLNDVMELVDPSENNMNILFGLK